MNPITLFIKFDSKSFRVSVRRYLLKKSLASLSESPRWSRIWIRLTSIAHLKKLKATRISWLDMHHDNSHPVREASITTEISPDKSKRNVNAPPIQLHILNNVCFTINASNFLTQQSAIVERFQGADNNIAKYNTGRIIDHDSTFAITHYTNAREIDSPKEHLFLGGNGGHNYFHWLIEILPKIQHFRECGNLNDRSVLLAPSFPGNHSTLDETLRLATEEYGDDIEIRRLTFNTLCFSKRLAVLTTPSLVLWETQKGESVRPCFQLREETTPFLRKLGEKAKSRAAGIPSQSKNRIFLKRKQGSSRGYNQNRVEEIMKKHGFQEVYCEDFDFAGQVRLFESADFICGPSGAAWTNIVFCKPKTKALSWLPTITQDFSAFSTLGHAVGVDFQFIFCKPVNNSKLHTAYEVDCTELEKQVKAMLA